MDKTDKKILAELLRDARQPFSSLAKKLNISRELATYRVNRLHEQGIIKEFTTEIDVEKLGFLYASLFLTITTEAEADFKAYLSTCPFAAWTSAFAGVWNFGVGIYGKDTTQIHERYRDIHERFKEHIIDHRLTLHRKTQQFYEKYVDAKLPLKKGELVQSKHDEKDLLLLKHLARQARMDAVHLAQQVGLSAVAVAKRLKRLERSGLILRYSVFVDPSKLGLYQFSVFVVNSMHTYQSIVAYLKEHQQVSFVIEYVGDPFLEFGIIVDDPFKMRGVLQEIESAFPDNKVTETFLIQQELLSIGLPPCVFE